MEVVSVISAAVSLVDVAARSSSVILELIVSWRAIPVEVVALSNEVNDSRLIYSEVYRLATQAQREPAGRYQCYASALQEQIRRAKPIWDELHGSIVEFASNGNQRHQLSKIKKLRFLRKLPGLERLRCALRQSRLNISELLISFSV
jgi:hypothetical protein